MTCAEALLPASGAHCLGLPLPAPDGAQIGSLSLLQSSLRLGPAAFTSDLAHAGSVLLLRSFFCVGLPLIALDFGNSGVSLLLQSHSCSGLPLPALGLGCAGLVFSMPVTDRGLSESLPLLHGTSWPELLLLVLSSATLGTSPLLHGLTRMDSAATSSGLARPGSVSFLPVPETSQPEPSLALQALARPGVPSSVSDHAKPDATMFTRSCACSDLLVPTPGIVCCGLPLSAPDCSSLGSVLPSRELSHLGFATLLLGRSKLDAPAAALDFADTESSLLPHSLAWLGSTMFAPNFAMLDISPSTRSLAWMGPATFTVGLACVGSVSLPLATDSSHSGSLLLLQSFS